MRLVVGLGVTGLSVARFLAARQLPFAATDSRSTPPGLDALTALGSMPTAIGRFECPVPMSELKEAVVSPGVDLNDPFIHALRAAGVPLVGDIELFARDLQTRPNAQVIGITGSNGKSTVTTLVGEMAKAAGKRVAVGGNLGTPALDLLDDQVELYVLELSSFQLDTTHGLKCIAATVLNVSPDHLDRHGSLEAYASAKARIYNGCGTAVVNRADAETRRNSDVAARVVDFGLDVPASGQYGLVLRAGETWLVQGGDALLPVGAMKVRGLHNAANALAALALGTAAGLPRAAMLQALREFPGLPHRCAWVAEIAGVSYYNDSKGTNVGATLAALAGLPGPVLLLAGGQAKGGDFTPWRRVLRDKGRALVLFGQDAAQIAREVGDVLPQYQVNSLREAVQQSAGVARPGDTVLLSPGCASFDQFKGYADRGNQFVAEVQRLGAGVVA